MYGANSEMYAAMAGSILSLFGSIAKHPSEATLPARYKANDIVLADSDTHYVPYVYLVGSVLILIVALVILFKK